MYVECAACEKFSFFRLSDINEETQNRFKISDIHVVLTRSSLRIAKCNFTINFTFSYRFFVRPIPGGKPDFK